MMRSVCVYLGANPGNDVQFMEAAILLGHAIAEAGYRLVYGGSSQGLMGTLANAVLARGGNVVGIIPKHLVAKEKPLTTINELIYTETMRERKHLLAQHADAFIVMPGGLGTLEETFETWNAIKLGTLIKPIGFLNINGFFDGLFAFIANCITHDFISENHAHIPKVNPHPHVLLDELLPIEELI